MQWLQPLGGRRNNYIYAACNHPVPFVLKQGWADKGHIAGYEGYERIFCRMQRAGQAAQDASATLEVWIDRNAKECIIFRRSVVTKTSFDKDWRRSRIRRIRGRPKKGNSALSLPMGSDLPPESIATESIKEVHYKKRARSTKEHKQQKSALQFVRWITDAM